MGGEVPEECFLEVEVIIHLGRHLVVPWSEDVYSEFSVCNSAGLVAPLLPWANIHHWSISTPEWLAPCGFAIHHHVCKQKGIRIRPFSPFICSSISISYRSSISSDVPQSKTRFSFKYSLFFIFLVVFGPSLPSPFCCYMAPQTPPSGGLGRNSQNQTQNLVNLQALTPSSSTSDSPYFLPLASRSSTSPSAPSSPYSRNTPFSSSGPVIKASFMTRNDNSNPTSPDQPPSSNSHHLSPETIQEFALHIPAPPTLSLSQSAVRNPPLNATNLAPRVSVSSMPSPMPNKTLDSFPSPMDRTRRMPPSHQTPDMTLSSSPTVHTLSVMLPRSIQPEMVTISANKGDRLRVVADAWHMEGESEFCLSFFSVLRPTFRPPHIIDPSSYSSSPYTGHYEWQISFPPSDVDIRAVHAKFHPDGRLTIDVKRRHYFWICSIMPLSLSLPRFGESMTVFWEAACLGEFLSQPCLKK